MRRRQEVVSTVDGPADAGQESAATGNEFADAGRRKGFGARASSGQFRSTVFRVGRAVRLPVVRLRKIRKEEVADRTLGRLSEV